LSEVAFAAYSLAVRPAQKVVIANDYAHTGSGDSCQQIRDRPVGTGM